MSEIRARIDRFRRRARLGFRSALVAMPVLIEFGNGLGKPEQRIDNFSELF